MSQDECEPLHSGMRAMGLRIMLFFICAHLKWPHFYSSTFLSRYLVATPTYLLLPFLGYSFCLFFSINGVKKQRRQFADRSFLPIEYHVHAFE